ncbi:hypothetical protein MOD25_05410 [Bacillus haynesii]|nr:hypothetical protein [Bacillus haynesii]MCY8549338.1 hypothetical protein [Bacillus haynesii]
MDKLWKYNTTTGFWEYVRDIAEGNGSAWLDIFQKAEPNSHFKVSKRRPK